MRFSFSLSLKNQLHMSHVKPSLWSLCTISLCNTSTWTNINLRFTPTKNHSITRKSIWVKLTPSRKRWRKCYKRAQPRSRQSLRNRISVWPISTMQQTREMQSAHKKHKSPVLEHLVQTHCKRSQAWQIFWSRVTWRTGMVESHKSKQLERNSHELIDLQCAPD